MRIGAGGGAAAGVATLPLLLNSDRAASPARRSPTDSTHEHHAQQESDHEGHSLSSTVGDVDIARMGFDPSTF